MLFFLGIQWVCDYGEILLDDVDGFRNVQSLNYLILSILVIECLLFGGFFWMVTYDILTNYVYPTIFLSGMIF